MKIAITCRVTEIPDYIGDASRRFFHLLAIPTLLHDPANPQLVAQANLPYLEPWHYGTLAGLTVWAGPAVGPFAAVAAANVSTYPANPMPLNSLTGLIGELEAVIADQCVSSPLEFFWNPSLLSSREAERVFYFHNYIAAHAHRPPPIPQNLGLSYFFSVSTASIPAGQMVLAAPLYTASAQAVLGGATLPAVPTNFAGSPPNLFQCAYAGVQGLAATDSINAYFLISNGLAPGKAHLPTTTPYWVDRPAGLLEWDRVAWYQTVQSKVADVFDFAERIYSLASMQSQQVPGSSARQVFAAHVDSFKTMLISALADRINVGVRKRSGGRSLFADALDALPQTLQPTDPGQEIMFHEALTLADQSMTVQAWQNIVCAAIPELSRPTSTGQSATFAPASGELPDQYMADALAMVEQLRKPANVATAVGAIWQYASSKAFPQFLAGTNGGGPQPDSSTSFFGSYGQLGGIHLSNEDTWSITLDGIVQSMPAGNGPVTKLSLGIWDGTTGIDLLVSLSGPDATAFNWSTNPAANPAGPAVVPGLKSLGLQLSLDKINNQFQVAAFASGGGTLTQTTLAVATIPYWAAVSVRVGVWGPANSSLSFNLPVVAASAMPQQALPNQAQSFWNSNRQAFQAFFQGQSLNSSLKLANIAAAWPAILDAAPAVGQSDRECLVEAVQTKMGEYWTERFSTAVPTGLYVDRTPQATIPGGGSIEASVAGKVTDLIGNYPNGYVSLIAEQLWPSTQQGTTSQSASMVIQVDRHGSFTTSADDPMADMQGYGLLMRYAGDPNTWRCMNIADVSFASTPPGPYTDIGNLLVAVMPAAQEGSRFSHITYDNASIVCGNIKAGFVQQHSLTAGSASGVDPVGPFFKYSVPQPVAPGNPSWFRMPMLKYGKSYEVAPFLLGPGGALPAKLAGSAAGPNPTKLIAPPAAGTLTPPATSVRTIQYLRSVGVSRPVVREVSPKNLPNGVYPLAKELFLPLPLDGSAPPSSGPETVLSTGKAQDPPLIVLDSLGGDTRQIQVQMPVCDLEVWDRWFSADIPPDTDPNPGSSNPAEVKQAVRRAVLAGVRRNVDTKPAALKSNQLDLSNFHPRDPAVEDFLFLEIYEVYPNAGEGAGTFYKIDFTFGTSGLSTVQSQPVPIKCVTANGSSDFRFDGPTAAQPISTLTIKPGVVVEARFYAPVQQAWFEGSSDVRFQAGVIDPAGTTSFTSNNVAYYLLAPNTIVFEAAAPIAETWQQLPNYIIPSRIGRRVLLSLNRGSNQLKQALDYAHEIDVYHQRWRWTGLPTAEFPVSDPIAQKLWEAEGFAGREDDYQVYQTCLVKTEAALASGFEQIHLLYEEDLGSDNRAHYYRFAIRVHSRYDGFGTNYRSIDILAAGGTPKGQFIPAAATSTIQKPSFDYYIPITDVCLANTFTDEGDVRGPGVFCITEEPWFSLGGVYEELSGDFVTVTDPGNQSPAKVRPEFGPDVLLSSTAYQGSKPSLLVSRPFGLSFDMAGNAKRINASAFLVAPAIDAGVDSYSNYFAKIVFRRSIYVDGPTGGSILPSDASDAAVVQFQAPMSFVDGIPIENFGLTTSLPNTSLAIIGQWDPSSLAPKRLQIGAFVPEDQNQVASNNLRKCRWLILSKKITESSGSTSVPQEAYVGLFAIRNTNENYYPCVPFAPNIEIPSSNLIGRLLLTEQTVDALNSAEPLPQRVLSFGRDLSASWQMLLPYLWVNQPFDLTLKMQDTAATGANSDVTVLAISYNEGQLSINGQATPLPSGAEIALTANYDGAGNLSVAYRKLSDDWSTPYSNQVTIKPTFKVQLCLTAGANLQYVQPTFGREPYDLVIPSVPGSGAPEDSGARFVGITRSFAQVAGGVLVNS